MEQDLWVILGSSHPAKQVEMGKASRSSYEQEAINDMEPPEASKAHRELACDPGYIPKEDEVN